MVLAAGARQAEDAAPKATLDDTNTDSQLAGPADSSWSEPIDISEDASATGSISRSDCRASGRKPSKAGPRARATS